MRLTFLFILSGLLFQSFAQLGKWHAKVEVRYAGNKSFEQEIRSYVSRELRALGDVDQTEKGADYRINIYSLKTATVSGTPTGYAVHVTVTSPAETLFELFQFMLTLTHEQQVYIEEHLAGYEYEEHSTMYLWPLTDLDKLAKKMIAEDVDGEFFESARKIHRRAIESMKSKEK